MTTMTAERVSKNPADLRRALIAVDELILTFHGKPYAHVMTPGRAERERAELKRLRSEVEDLRAQLKLRAEKLEVSPT
ncbi:hypothetical protein [Amycolatopsis sp. ATCC 39116]|uniref:hypothetical protein n=1 Tax=Amycolatopsis sp. (strain ATCC 39116 / 75iv2) TaxID=385957 RepID=UPI000262590B|nr:hypothetical protein [Amycolatopsis sp. ATCC 39116]